MPTGNHHIETIARIALKTALVLFCFFAVRPIPGVTQFIQFNFSIESEVGTRLENNLDFGFLNPNQVAMINLGDANMGIFSITGLASQFVSVELVADEHLVHNQLPDCEDSTCRIEVELRAAYANEGQRMGDIGGAFLFQGGRAMFPLLTGSTRRADRIHTSYLYLFGYLDVKDVLPGTYQGEVTLLVEFQ